MVASHQLLFINKAIGTGNIFTTEIGIKNYWVIDKGCYGDRLLGLGIFFLLSIHL